MTDVTTARPRHRPTLRDDIATSTAARRRSTRAGACEKMRKYKEGAASRSSTPRARRLYVASNLDAGEHRPLSSRGLPSLTQRSRLNQGARHDEAARVVCLPGDGNRPEVIAEAVRCCARWPLEL